ncbi:H-type small acid-soluble spore protein [Alkalibacillus haloalkaliphilus]|uniref:H-type small acid-soluble spore protein n=1 Tax=Alkalibacillus haloalkaliphilus TaxID=94136 RepID=UPI002935CF33|nr:H-type small acid-soluble spore protein [Alkalibacillus haloalkaliphilus]MDV2582773.1 H-type small acid-soluble spore protein [Alkalibacillus haloalkaliphilus]
MDQNRAKEISQSRDMKDVQYNGERIYIQDVDENSGKARVYSLNDPGKQFDVEVGQLVEKDDFKK